MLRRGFKAEANWLARDVRKSLGLPATAPLAPLALAEHLGIAVLGLRSFETQCGAAVRYFTGGPGQSRFSAVTIHKAGARIIIHNDRHHPKRQAANLAHELAHALLHHPPHALLSPEGERTYEETMEAEAEWLSAALLISEEAALWIVEQEISEGQASDFFGVSIAIVRWRIQVTGARKRIVTRRSNAA